MFKATMQEPWRFADGTFLEAFRHDNTVLSIYHDGTRMTAFGFTWPTSSTRRQPEASTGGATAEETMVCWHRDFGLRSDKVTSFLDGELGRTDPKEFTEFPQLVRLLDTAGASLPPRFRDEIRAVLSERI